jgi:hypothetical protein
MAQIYMATNKVNGKRYVGITAGYLSQRKSKHLYAAIKLNWDYPNSAIGPATQQKAVICLDDGRTYVSSQGGVCCLQYIGLPRKLRVQLFAPRCAPLGVARWR